MLGGIFLNNVGLQTNISSTIDSRNCIGYRRVFVRKDAWYICSGFNFCNLCRGIVKLCLPFSSSPGLYCKNILNISSLTSSMSDKVHVINQIRK